MELACEFYTYSYCGKPCLARFINKNFSKSFASLRLCVYGSKSGQNVCNVDGFYGQFIFLNKTFDIQQAGCLS